MRVPRFRTDDGSGCIPGILDGGRWCLGSRPAVDGARRRIRIGTQVSLLGFRTWESLGPCRSGFCRISIRRLLALQKGVPSRANGAVIPRLVKPNPTASSAVSGQRRPTCHACELPRRCQQHVDMIEAGTAVASTMGRILSAAKPPNTLRHGDRMVHAARLPTNCLMLARTGF
jgi:hypothetical protein